MYNTINERLMQFIKSNGLSVRDVANAIQMNENTLSSKVRGDRSIDVDTLLSILSHYEGLSAEWLLRGEGDMYRTDANVHSKHKAEVQTAEDVPSKEVLLVPAGARGGSLDHFEAKVGLNPYNAEVIRSPFINADFAWPVKDDSMSPDYPAGTVLFVKRLVTSIIKWGNSYLFDTDDGFQFVRLRRSELGDEYIHCVPINAEDYEPYDVPKSDIHGIYKVLGAMRW